MNLRRHAVLALVAGAAIVALAGCGKSTSPTAADPVLDQTPPNPPSSLSSTYISSVGYDYLYWNLSTSPSANGYEVWEATTPSGTAVRIAVAGPAINHLQLPQVDVNGTRYYQVRATRANGPASAFSSRLPVVRHVIVTLSGGSVAGGGESGLRVSD